jgi:hypothetical protein
MNNWKGRVLPLRRESIVSVRRDLGREATALHAFVWLKPTSVAKRLVYSSDDVYGSSLSLTLNLPSLAPDGGRLRRLVSPRGST